MRQVYNNDMVAHLWANQSQESARSNKCNFHFSGVVLYSYNTPIANFVTDKHGNRVALVYNGSYSITTSSHQSYARSALGYSDNKVTPYFDVPHIGVSGGYNQDYNNQYHQQNVDDMLSSYSNRIKAAKRTRDLNEWQKPDSLLNEIKSYFEHFDVTITLPNLESDWQSVVEHHAAKQTPEKVAKREKERLARVERSRRDYREVRGIYNENLSSYYSHRDDSIFTPEDRAERQANLSLLQADKIAAWRNGTGYQLPYLSNVLMRVRGDNVETSRGATFPIEHARKAFPLVKACREHGRTFDRNGHSGEYVTFDIHNTFSSRLGHFHIDKIDMGGNVTAGCHYVEWCEIEHVARQLDLIAEDDLFQNWVRYNDKMNDAFSR